MNSHIRRVADEQRFVYVNVLLRMFFECQAHYIVAEAVDELAIDTIPMHT